MRESAAKNWRDYFIYFVAGTSVMGVMLLLLSPLPKRLYTLAPIAGVLVAAGVQKRDEQHRTVPAHLAINPNAFAHQVTVALDNGLAQLQATEKAALRIASSADTFSAAVIEAKRLAAPPQENQPYLGKGFENDGYPNH